MDSRADALAAMDARLDQLDASRSATELELLEAQKAQRQLQKQIADVGASIITAQERAEMLESRVKELSERIVALSSRCESLEAKAESLMGQLESHRSELARSEGTIAELLARQEQVTQQYDQVRQMLNLLQANLEDEKAGTIDLLRRTAQLHNEISTYSARQKDLTGQRQRLADRAKQIDRALEQLLTDRAAENEKLRDVEGVLNESHRRLERAKLQQRQFAEQAERLGARLAELREQRSALLSRMTALEEMQQRFEGLGEGVKAVLKAVRAGQLEGIRGILGDFIKADVERAAVVEAALSGAEQFLLADSRNDVLACAGRLAELIGDEGCVEIACLDQLAPYGSDLQTGSIPHAVARAIDCVSYPPELAPLMWRLLGKTVVVLSLSEAVAAAQRAPVGTRFVTLEGDVLEADGRIRIGAARGSAGVISRRSELEQLKQRQTELDGQIERVGEELELCRTRAAHAEEVVQRLRTAIYEANTELVAGKSRLEQIDEKIAALKDEQPVIAADLEHIAAAIEKAVHDELQAKQRAEELQRRNEQRNKAIDELTARIASQEKQRDELARQLTQLKVELASFDQKKQSLLGVIATLQEQLAELQQELQAGRDQIKVDQQRRREARQQIDEARREVDRLYGQQESLNQSAEDMAESRNSLEQRLEQIRIEVAAKRKERDEAAAQLNESKVEIGETDVRIENLITRASEDLGTDLPSLYEGYEHDTDRDWDAVAAEIEDLRGKIERLGNVNLDAIEEQDELESRREFLAGQLSDVKASRDKLNELIRRINAESRNRFAETFAALRTNFQELFRKLFGGGKADIFLVDPDDVLESPIEIIARPPGKELRSLSLLSGGEKTMTAIALLFSIFKTRPSPFCLLDEVDAALDETNNERFGRLIQQFAESSQFIVISHAKRTMSLANVLYGVTMQEPGVSKRISVRFEQIADKQVDEALAPLGV